MPVQADQKADAETAKQDNQKELINEIDRMLKHILTLSKGAVLNLINGLYPGADYPPGTDIVFLNRKPTNEALEHGYADFLLQADHRYYYHLKAQIAADKDIAYHAFQYGARCAVEFSQGTGCDIRLPFPNPFVINFAQDQDVPTEDFLHVIVTDQESFDYRVPIFSYLNGLGELEQNKQDQLIILIPFQMLRLQTLFYDESGNVNIPAEDEFLALKKGITDAIMNSIETNCSSGNLTHADAAALIVLTQQLYKFLLKQYRNRGGDAFLNTLRPEALEMPKDNILFHIGKM